jgi:hypothetical protein
MIHGFSLFSLVTSLNLVAPPSPARRPNPEGVEIE